MSESTYATLRTDWQPGYVRLFRGGGDPLMSATLSDVRRSMEYQLVFRNLKNTFYCRGGGEWVLDKDWDGWVIFNTRNEIVVSVHVHGFTKGTTLVLEEYAEDPASTTGSRFRDIMRPWSQRKSRTTSAWN